MLVNTVLGMAIDTRRRTYRLGSGAGGGGLSGPAIRPVAVRAVHDCRAAFPDAGIVGVGGIAKGADVAEMLLAGADAVEVGTATFRDPRPRRGCCRASCAGGGAGSTTSPMCASWWVPCTATATPTSPRMHRCLRRPCHLRRGRACRTARLPRPSVRRPVPRPPPPISPTPTPGPSRHHDVTGRHGAAPRPARPPVTRPDVRPRIPRCGPLAAQS